MSEMKRTLECPFTWNIDQKIVPELNSCKDQNRELEDDLNKMDHPLVLLMNYLTFAYVDIIINKDYNNALLNLKKTTETWSRAIDQVQLAQDGISVEVLIHVIGATKYYIYKEIGDATEANKILDDLKDFKNFTSQIDLGTLYGCKTMIWHVLYEPGKKDAVYFAKLAIEHSPKCSLWHFMLGKHLRFVRRNEGYNMIPSDEEASMFLEAYNLSKSPNYGIYVSQMHREKYDYNKGYEIYLEIYNMKPTNLYVQLRLALGFIRKKDFQRAKSCLDYVEKFAPNDTRFLHYKGIYFQKQNDLKSAVQYFKKSITMNTQNFPAEKQYVVCMQKFDKKFEFTKYCQAMLEKYNEPYRKQDIAIILALAYIPYKQYEKAMKYFLQAIKLDPKSHMLQKYYDCRKIINIIHVIRNDLLPEIKKLTVIPVDVQNMVDEFENFISKYSYSSR